VGFSVGLVHRGEAVAEAGAAAMSASYFASGVRTLWENAEGFLVGANFIPSREASLVAFCNHFSSLISATPAAGNVSAEW